MLSNLLFLGFGIVCAAIGGELFVRGLLGVAWWLRLPASVIGVTVAAFATSSPELTVAINAAAEGRSEIALGDALGSNIVNIGLVVGLLLLAGAAARDLSRRDALTALALIVLMGFLVLDGELQVTDGVVLLVVFAGWLATRSSAHSNCVTPGRPTPGLNRTTKRFRPSASTGMPAQSPRRSSGSSSWSPPESSWWSVRRVLVPISGSRRSSSGSFSSHSGRPCRSLQQRSPRGFAGTPNSGLARSLEAISSTPASSLASPRLSHRSMWRGETSGSVSVLEEQCFSFFSGACMASPWGDGAESCSSRCTSPPWQCCSSWKHEVDAPRLSSLVLSNETRRGNVPSTVVVYVIRDERCSLDHPLGDAIEVLIRRDDAERFPEEVRKDDSERLCLSRVHLRLIS